MTKKSTKPLPRKIKLQLVTFPTKSVGIKCSIHGVQKVVSIPNGGVMCEKCKISSAGWEIEFLMFLGDWLIRTKGQPHPKEEMEIVHKIRFFIASELAKEREKMIEKYQLNKKCLVLIDSHSFIRRRCIDCGLAINERQEKEIIALTEAAKRVRK